MVKYNNFLNDFFVASGFSGSVIAFMGNCSLESMQWVLKIPRDNPWKYPEVNLWNNSIEIQTHFIQESNYHSMWDTTGETNLTTKKLSRLEVVIYAAVEWLSKCGQIPDYLRV